MVMDMKKKGFLRQKQYAIAGALVVIAAVGTTALYSNRQERQREQMEAELAEEMNRQAENEAVASAGDEEPSAEASAVIPPKETESTETAELEEKEDADDETETEEGTESVEETAGRVPVLHFSEENGLMWPMEGNVVINYSMDSTVYFPTLDQYKYNPAVIISGEVNDKVYAVAKGRIAEIKNDEVTGCTVTLDLGDGYQAVYGQLKELNFAKGDYVEAGYVLGCIGEPTKYFSVEGSNLYFALSKDGESIDPVMFFE